MTTFPLVLDDEPMGIILRAGQQVLRPAQILAGLNTCWPARRMMPIGSSSSTRGKVVMPPCEASFLPQDDHRKCREIRRLAGRARAQSSIRHVQGGLRRVELTRRLDRRESSAVRAAACLTLDLPAAIQSLQHLRAEGDDFAGFRGRWEDHVHATRRRPDLKICDQGRALFGAQLGEAGGCDHDERRRKVGEPAPEVDHERLERATTQLLADGAALRSLYRPQVLVEEKYVRVM